MRILHPLRALVAGGLATFAVTTVAGAQGSVATPGSGSVPAGARSTLSLRQAVQLALQNNPRLLAAAGSGLRRIGEASAQSAFANPHLEWRREGFGTTGDADDFLTLALPVDLTGRRLVARGAVKATARSAAADSAAVTRSVAFDAARAYHLAALASALRGVADSHSAALESIARQDSTRWREGAVSEATALRTSLEWDRGRAAAALAAIDEARFHASLANALGASPDSLGAPTPLSVELLSTRSDGIPPLPSIEQLMLRASEQRPELVAAREAVEAAGRMVTVERLGVLGDVTLGGGTRSTGGETGGTIAVGVSLPLLDRNGPARQRASAGLMNAQAALRATELSIRAEVASASAAYERLRVGVAPLAAPAGRRGADVATITLAAYREGAATLLELLDAQRVAAEMDAEALRWLTELQLARLDLLQAVGDQLPEAQ